ncbi:splicing factor 3B subunit1-like HEAT repeat containing protein [Cryptosporidium ryanae]|uniref:splicing factor 3B subunit1-like HEAT repeat containing protein n=1 Tax=Cryptosporidium ryanae TaxID=515981 RepID=UPI00351A8A02|nr:splicing factor 3B subunit1-like HEAT repeat containing protein [Cryptosporidium ryanae]
MSDSPRPEEGGVEPGEPEDRRGLGKEGETAVGVSKRRKKRWDIVSCEDKPPDAGGIRKEDGVDAREAGRQCKKSRWDSSRIVAEKSEAGASDGDPRRGTGERSAAADNTSDARSSRTVGKAGSFGDGHREYTDEELNEMLPVEGYEILEPPEGYEEMRRNLRSKFKAAESEMELYEIPAEGDKGASNAEDVRNEAAESNTSAARVVHHEELGELALKLEDYQFFGKLFAGVSGEDLSSEDVKEREVLSLLLKIKNGTPQIRKRSSKQLIELSMQKDSEIDHVELVLNGILPLMMQSTLEEQERHVLVKTMDRLLQRLGEKARPFVHKILVVIEPMLIDQDYYARMEGREIISNLSKAVGLATMIATMRPDIDHPDEYVRNTTARAFAVLASSLGIPSLAMFLQAVCQSKKSWQARHTGIKIVQQIAILMGSSVLPHLKKLVYIISHGLNDDNQKIRIMTALAISALAEASSPYGIEAFQSVFPQIWKGITEYRSKGLSSYLKTMGNLLPIMDKEQAAYYIHQISPILIREFGSQEEEMRRVVLKVAEECVLSEEISLEYIRSTYLAPFFGQFWTPRNSMDKKICKQVIGTTLVISKRVGKEAILENLVLFLRDSSEPFRRMTLEALRRVLGEGRTALNMEHRLEKLLVDGVLYIFQENTSEEEDGTIVDDVGEIMRTLGKRSKQYLPQVSSIVRWRLNTPSPKMRQMAADLVAKLIKVMKECEEEQMIAHIGLFLYEYLGEEYPEVLGSILGALKEIVAEIELDKMTPPIKDLVPRLTPILKNRHEKVQENIIELLGLCAKRGGDMVSPKEWDRICFDLLDSLKANKKSIRRSSVKTFGYISRTIGPQDVLVTLLNNLRVQERQLRVCTTVAIAIIAENCMPYTVLPALMNEYKIPDLNVQNGVLKTLSFMFEYIGMMSKDYIYAVTPLLEVALIDRDQVHRQTAAWACKHLALGVVGTGRNDALVHLLNYLWPNIFENSPHLIQAVLEAIDAFRVSLGPGTILHYLLQGLFHPAKKVRSVYWRIYNNLYISSQDALVPFFPVLPGQSGRSYRTRELYYTM